MVKEDTEIPGVHIQFQHVQEQFLYTCICQQYPVHCTIYQHKLPAHSSLTRKQCMKYIKSTVKPV